MSFFDVVADFGVDGKQRFHPAPPAYVDKQAGDVGRILNRNFGPVPGVTRVRGGL